MSNYSKYDEPVPCPYCGSDCHADFVDVGVGMIQCGPYHCDCGASEIGPELYDWTVKVGEANKYGRQDTLYDETGRPVMKEDSPFSETELETNWYDPNKKKVSPYANTVGGVLVDHKTAKEAYDIGLLDDKILPF